MMQFSSPYRIALIGPDRQVYVHGFPGDKRTPVTDDVAGMTYDWPTWSPDGARLSFVGAPVGGSQGTVGLYIVDDPGRSVPRQIFQEPGSTPFYLAWSPDNSRIAFLAGGAPGSGATVVGLRLRVISADGGPPAPWSLEGQPDFFAWRPDSSELLVHIGGNGVRNPDAYIGRVDARTGALKRLSVAPGEFRAPSWSKDGKQMLLATIANAGQGVVVMDESGGGDILAQFARDAQFQWSPDSTRAAVLLGKPEAQTPGGHLYLLDTSAGKEGARRLSDADVLGFWWAPHSRQIAYLAADLSRKLLVLYVFDGDRGEHLRLASLAPSESTALLLGFFDQYALSSSFWSPDGRYFLYSGHTLHEQSNGHQHQEEPEVFVVAVDGSEPPRSIGQGLLGVWAPG